MSSTVTAPPPPLNSSALPDNVIEQFKKCACRLPRLLEITIKNATAYYQDSLTQLATLPLDPINPAALGGNFYPLEVAADIVEINGDTKVKGLYLSRNLVTLCSPTPQPGTMISDTSMVGFRQDIFKILYPDPDPSLTLIEIGSITASGVSGQPESPGQPPPITGGDWAITGGTGAFLGVTGQMGGERGAGTIRAAWVKEDPSRRKINASPLDTGKIGLYVIPMCPPQIIEVFHPGYWIGLRYHPPVPVTFNTPAKVGQQLILYATGLGPVRDNNGNEVPIGQPFLQYPPFTVISPVTITIDNIGLGGTTTTFAPVSAQGVPGSSNGYSVEFVLPAVSNMVNTEATSIQISSAWIESAKATLFVQ